MFSTYFGHMKLEVNGYTLPISTMFASALKMIGYFSFDPKFVSFKSVFFATLNRWQKMRYGPQKKGWRNFLKLFSKRFQLLFFERNCMFLNVFYAFHKQVKGSLGIKNIEQGRKWRLKINSIKHIYWKADIHSVLPLHLSLIPMFYGRIYLLLYFIFFKDS